MGTFLCAFPVFEALTNYNRAIAINGCDLHITFYADDSSTEFGPAGGGTLPIDDGGPDIVVAKLIFF